MAAVFTQSNNAISPQPYGNNTPSMSYEVLGKYMLTEKFEPVISYTRLTQTVAGRRTKIIDYEELGFSYVFNKNVQAFVDYKFNNVRNNNSGIDGSDKLDMGISYHW